MAFGLIGLVGVIGSGAAHALIFASPDMEPAEAVPPDFPYWEHVTQRRYQGPSVLYLGGGWGLTARHVGMGEVFLEGRIFAPIAGSQRTLLNLDGSPADLMVFEIDRSEGDPGLPLLPLARRPVERGDQVLLIGFGRGRARVVEWDADGTSQFGFQWDAVGRKRWGTNRIDLVGERVNQGAWSTITIGFGFDPPLGARTTRYEAAAATGDSGGAVFVQRDGTWELAGVMTSVTGTTGRPDATSTYGDRTYAADVAAYRSEILRWTRPACANEQDDDGDEAIDFPDDPGCRDLEDDDERDRTDATGSGLTGIAIALGLAIGGALALVFRIRQRGQSTPSSTSDSTAD
ncbi:MAG TPA: hypothetical protein PLW10_23870 [Myxococcota bacterium]|nr:hypothetical protein [Myxococcota bacterium]